MAHDPAAVATSPHVETTDVLVVGGGIAGLAAAISLRRRGLRTRCIEPNPSPRVRVGESLDWSAPSLLRMVGIADDEIVGSGDGTLKREVHGFTEAGRHLVAGPPSWLGSWPLRFETVTLHVDRERFDLRLFEAASRAGVELVWDRVRDVHVQGDRVVGCSTLSGTMHVAEWYVDASGRNRLIGRAAGVGVSTWGSGRVALWSQRRSTRDAQGTVLHLSDARDDLAWAWEIPIDPRRTSVGAVLALDEFRELRRPGVSTAEAFATALNRFPRLEPLPDSPPPSVRTYQPSVSDRTVGSNWIMVGEAAALIDPLSSIGVTNALRHGTEAAAIIADDYLEADRTRERLSTYDRRVRRIGAFYNDAITDLLYRPQVRRKMGLKQAARAYIIPGYLTNAFYSRLRPSASRVRDTAMMGVVSIFQVWAHLWSIGSRVSPTGGPHQGSTTT